MDGFNFAFSLFALLLGLSLAEVLSGFSRALRRRRIVHLGWLTPLLAFFVMLDLTSFWEFGWSYRKYVNPGYGYLLIGLIVSGLYYIAASIIFPGEFGERADFDAHYMQHRRQVLGAVTICDFIEVVPILIVRFNEIPTRVWIENAIQSRALLTGIISKNKRANIAALSVLIGMYLYSAVMTFIQPVLL